MSEVRFVVRDTQRDWSTTIHGSDADRAIAALSADPATVAELDIALTRFAKSESGGRLLLTLNPGSCDEPYDAGLVAIDLVARLVVVNSSYSSPGREGYVDYHDGRCCTDICLRYHLADDWQFLYDADNWRRVAEQRRLERAAKPVLDARLVLYGRPLVEFVAREAFAAFSRRAEIAAVVRMQWAEQARERLARAAGCSPDEVDADRLTEEEIVPQTWPGQSRYADLYYDTLKEIHASWLLTPRDDLGGVCPREIALERHGHLNWDMEDRCNAWSRLGCCPPGLAESSHAYRYAGFGTHELVKYYDLVRELLWSCWMRLGEFAEAPNAAHRPDALLVGDFLTDEVPRLERIRDSWFDEPDLECHGRTPRSIIDRERTRLPEGMSGREAIHDPDCPCCHMMADLPGPVFWHLDGCNMDHEFAFDIYHRTRAEWDEEQAEMERFHKKFDAEQAERQRLGVSERDRGEQGEWKRSFVVGETADVPLGIRVFGLGCRLAEVIVGLRGGDDRTETSAEAQSQIDRLNRDFGNLRELLQSEDVSLAVALLDPVLDRFVETLSGVAADHPELAQQCESLEDSLRNLVAPPPPEPDWSSGDMDIPF